MAASNAILKVGDLAPDALVLDSQGRPVAISDLWQHSPILLSFLRHFGCLFCREHLALLEQHARPLLAAGLTLYALGMGKPKHARTFCSSLAPSVLCLSDDSAASYYAYGLRQASLPETPVPDLLKAGARAVSRGHIGGRPIGDPRMMPGLFLIDREGIVRYSRYARHAGDQPGFEDVLHAAQSL